MLTVGHLLREARLKQNISFAEAEKATKIRKKYLVALERNNYKALPGRAYISGFIRNYSEYLHLDVNRVMAVFRREYTDYHRPSVLPKGLTAPVNVSWFTLTPRIAAIIASGVLLFIFFVYLFVEYRFVAVAPHLSLDRPTNAQVAHGDSITVQGRSDPDASVSINDQPVTLQIDGQFSAEIKLTHGANKIIVVATNKFGKKAEIKRTVEYVIP